MCFRVGHALYHMHKQDAQSTAGQQGLQWHVAYTLFNDLCCREVVFYSGGIRRWFRCVTIFFCVY